MNIGPNDKIDQDYDNVYKTDWDNINSYESDRYE